MPSGHVIIGAPWIAYLCQRGENETGAAQVHTRYSVIALEIRWRRKLKHVQSPQVKTPLYLVLIVCAEVIDVESGIWFARTVNCVLWLFHGQ